MRNMNSFLIDGKATGGVLVVDGRAKFRLSSDRGDGTFDHFIVEGDADSKHIGHAIENWQREREVRVVGKGRTERMIDPSTGHYYDRFYVEAEHVELGPKVYRDQGPKSSA